MHFVLRNDGFIQIVEGIEIMDALQGTDPVRPRADVFVAFLSHFWWTFWPFRRFSCYLWAVFGSKTLGWFCVCLFLFCRFLRMILITSWHTETSGRFYVSTKVLKMKILLLKNDDFCNRADEFNPDFAYLLQIPGIYIWQNLGPNIDPNIDPKTVVNSQCDLTDPFPE